MKKKILLLAMLVLGMAALLAVGANAAQAAGQTNYEMGDANMDGAIIGKAFYAGTIDLALAVKEAGEQC